jgi:response regulator RpfG family c-di-GMP phosphodiesterase
MDQTPRVLVVDDELPFARLVAEALKEREFEPVVCATADEALHHVAAGVFGVAVIDLQMPAMGGLDLADRIREISPDTQIVVLTGHGDVDTAIEGIKRGVFDFLQKANVNLPRLERAVQGGLDRFDLLQRYREAVDRLNDSNLRLKALHAAATTLTEETHLDRLLDKLVAAAKGVSGAWAAQVLLLEPTPGGGYVIQRAIGDRAEEALEGARLAAGEGIAVRVADTGSTVSGVRARDLAGYSPRCDELLAPNPGFICASLGHRALRGALSVAGRPGGFDAEDAEMISNLARTAAVSIENALAQERSVNFFTHVSEILVSVLESVDVLNPGHSRHVAALADMMTRRLGLSDTERRNVHFAALLHDIGKVRLDPAILTAPAPLAAEARRQLEAHPALALDLLKPIITWEEILPIIHAHHERWDGSGYPRGLGGEDIPLGARVVAIADAFDAMTRSPVYGVPRSEAAALAELEACAGSQFDPRLTRLFVAAYREHRDQIPG